MKIYIPVTKFKSGGVLHGMEVLNSDECRIIGGCITSRGTIYGQHAYTDPEGVRLYWAKEDYKADAFRYRF